MSVSITKKPVLPVIAIEKTDDSTYVFNHFTGTYGFKIRGLSCRPPKDNQKGDFQIRLTSSTASNTDTNTLLSNIKRGTEILIWAGKTDPSIGSTTTFSGISTSGTAIFRGIIETLEIREYHKNYMDVYISGPDWGSDLLNSRIVYGQWAQKRDTDGITLLTTDNTTTIQQIVLDLLTQTSSYPSADFAVDDQGVSVTDTNIKVPGIQLASFVANYERLEDKLQELDAIGGTIHWIGPDKVFHMEFPTESTTSRPAEILITDDYTNATAIAWPQGQTKVGLIGLDSTYKITVENKKSRYWGIGGDLEAIDQDETVNGSSTTCFNQYIAMKFTPTKAFLEGVSLYVGYTGTPPTTSLTMLVVEDNAGNPTGDTLRSVKLDQRYITSTGAWSTWKTQVELNTAKSYWLILQINPGDNASNHYNWYMDNLAVNTSAVSSDGIAWTVDTTGYAYMYRTYITTPLITIMSDSTSLSTSGHYHEEVISKPDITVSSIMWKLLQGESSTGFKEKEMLKCKIYAPDTLLKSGQKIRVIKTSSGKSISTDGSPTNDDFILGSIEYQFESSDGEGTGSFWYDAELVRFVSYT